MVGAVAAVVGLGLGLGLPRGGRGLALAIFTYIRRFFASNARLTDSQAFPVC